MKRTPFFPLYSGNRLKLVSFNGWELPLEYQGMLAEAVHTRQAAGLFDISHMGLLKVRGKACKEFLEYMTCNEVARIPVNCSQYNLILNPQGGIIDDCIIHNLGEYYLSVVNASNREKVFSWFSSHLYSDVTIEDITFDHAMLSLQGPQSVEVLLGLDSSIGGLRYMASKQIEFNGIPLVVFRCGYTGEVGYELLCPKEYAVAVGSYLLERNQQKILMLCGLGARDILRVEAGLVLYGNELSEEIDPYQVDLAWVVKMSKKDFIGKQALETIREKGCIRKRVGFVLKDKCIARKGYSLFSLTQKCCGEVTSGVYSPILGKSIGMGYIERENGCFPTLGGVAIRGKVMECQMSTLPFIPSRARSENFVN